MSLEPASSVRFGPKIFSSDVSEVYSAIMEETRKFVAVKIFCEDFSQKDVDLVIKVGRQISHPNIVKQLGYILKEDRKALLLQLVTGGSLSSYLDDYGPFNETLIRKYTKQTIEALQYLRSKDIRHGRIRCDNLLSDLNGNIRLTQPRVKSLGLEDKQKYAYWSAPEIICQGKPNHKSDIWSLGCTIIEMATNKHPWNEDFQKISLFQKQIQQFRRPQIPNHLSLECRQFVQHCLTYSPEDRPTLQQLKQSAFLRRP